MAHLRRQGPRYFVGALLLVAYQSAQYWFDTQLDDAIDGAYNGKLEAALETGRWLIAVAIGAFVIRVASRVAIFNAGRTVEYELRRVLLSHLHRLGPSFYGTNSAGEIMSRATNDLGQVRLLLGFGVLNGINLCFGLPSALAVMLQISWQLTLAALSMFPLLILISGYFAKRIYTATRANQDAIGKLSEKVQSSIAGVRVVRAFALEDSELASFDRVNQNYLERSLALARLRGSMMPAMAAIIMLGSVIAFWYGSSLILDKSLSAGEFLAFTRAQTRLIWPLISLGFLLSIIQRGRAAYSRVAEIFAAKPDIFDGDRQPDTPAEGALEVKNLSFSYGEHQVLKDVSFKLDAGDSLAIVGRIGSGKSTLAALLARLQLTPENSVFLDGEDICHLSVERVRSTVGYAQQRAFLFSTTVGRNIGYALDNEDSKEAESIIESAAKEARVYEDILGFADGFDTVVGERGVQLSGGQKQRAGLARALVSTPKLLILDDPFSAVDAATETAILDAIDRQMGQRGIILITHRISAADRCSRVIVLEDGRIVESGRPEDLRESSGSYGRMAKEQQIEAELAQLGKVGTADVIASEDTRHD